MYTVYILCRAASERCQADFPKSELKYDTLLSDSGVVRINHNKRLDQQAHDDVCTYILHVSVHVCTIHELFFFLQFATVATQGVQPSNVFQLQILAWAL